MKTTRLGVGEVCKDDMVGVGGGDLGFGTQCWQMCKGGMAW